MKRLSSPLEIYSIIKKDTKVNELYIYSCTISYEIIRKKLYFLIISFFLNVKCENTKHKYLCTLDFMYTYKRNLPLISRAFTKKFSLQLLPKKLISIKYSIF